MLNLIYVKAVDFFNEISLLWAIVSEHEVSHEEAGKGFPDGFEYRW